MDAVSNRTAVWSFFRDNPCHSRLDCAAALGLHRKTVDAHAVAIREGWRPVEFPDPFACIIRAVSYPVCTSIDARGFGLHDIARGAE